MGTMTFWIWSSELNGSLALIFEIRYFKQNLFETDSCLLALTTQFCRIKKDAAVRGAPQPIIFERLKLPQQIIYRRKGNLSESPIHQKYWENILISRFYEQFSWSSRILGHFWKFEKISNHDTKTKRLQGWAVIFHANRFVLTRNWSLSWS